MSCFIFLWAEVSRVLQRMIFTVNGERMKAVACKLHASAISQQILEK
jgi:hypothetical protein